MKTNRIMSAILTLAVGFVSITSCSEKDDETIKGAVALDVNSAVVPETAQIRPGAIVIDGKGGTVTVPVTAGLPDGTAAQFSVTVAAQTWCHASVEGSILTVVIDKSDDTSGRVTSMEIAATAAGAEISPLTVSVQQGEKVIPSGEVKFDESSVEMPENATYTNGVVDMPYAGGSVSVAISNTLTEPVEVEYAIDGDLPAWCVAAIDGDKLVVEVEPSVTATVDQAVITVKATGKTETVNMLAGTFRINRAPFTSSMPMVLVKGGTYTMGAGLSWVDIWDDYTKVGRELQPSKNYYEYPVTLDPFYIATTEITQKLYQQVMGENPVKDFVGDNYPVVNISWSMACEFCNKLSEKEGLTPAYAQGDIIEIPDPWGWGPGTKIQDYTIVDGANGYRLATSAEWEFAAKGGNDGINNMTVYAGGNEEDDVLWYADNSKINNKESLREVAQKQPNALGLYDMSGNAAEWAYDWGTKYADRDERAAITGAVNPVGPEWKSGMDEKVSRGGSYRDYASKCTLYTETSTAADVTSAMGIRVVRSVK